MKHLVFVCTILLICTCGSFHPGRVEPTSPMYATTSRMDVPQVLCQKFSHSPFSIVRSGSIYSQFRVSLKRGCPRLQLASTSSEVVWAKGAPRSSHRRDDSQCGQASITYFGRNAPYMQDESGAAVSPLVPNLCASRIKCGGCCQR